MTGILVRALSSRELISGRLFGRLAARIAADHKIEHAMAERIVEQALAFLAATATAAATSKPLSPSEPVDIGWHTFLLYTRSTPASTPSSASGWPDGSSTTSHTTIPTRRAQIQTSGRGAPVLWRPSSPPATRLTQISGPPPWTRPATQTSVGAADRTATRTPKPRYHRRTQPASPR